MCSLPSRGIRGLRLGKLDATYCRVGVNREAQYKIDWAATRAMDERGTAAVLGQLCTLVMAG